MSSKEARPRQVTMAAWLVGAGSLFLLFSVVGEMGDLRTVSYREDLGAFLERQGWGLDVATAISISRVLLFVVGAAAAAAVVAAIYSARRDKAARIVASVAAALVFVLGAVADPLLAAFVAAGATLLWSGPAGDWFAGRPIRETPSLLAPRGDASRRPGQTPTAGSDGPGIAPGTGPASTPNAGPTATVRTSRPRRPAPQEVVLAAIITATTSAAVVIGMVFDTARYLLDPGSLQAAYAESGMRAEGITESFWTAGLVIGASLVIGWALAAGGLAFFATRGHSWARILLMISAGIAALITIAVAFSQPLALVVTLACLVTIYLLSRPVVGRWYAGPGAGPGTHADSESQSRTDA